MSIALGNNRLEQVSNGFLRMNKMSPYNLSPILDSGDRTMMRVVVKEERENENLRSCSSSSSSIGMNSDDENEEEINEEEEVQSKLKNTPFDSAVDALEQALPIRRGISKFYNGKSKSFASLGDAACSSIKEITKPENSYSRKRKNLLAYNLLYDQGRGRTSLLKSSGIGGGIAKRPTNSSRNTFAFAVAMNNCETSIDEDGQIPETNGRNNMRNPSVSPQSPLPPPWRSFSLADLQHCAVSASVVNSNLSSSLMGKRTNSDEVS